ncbi:MAG: hypothetical protein KDI71_03465 [Xanthomonadales bacterium]|nr:hypothetical protein [Xanthomonadales bacterium]
MSSTEVIRADGFEPCARDQSQFSVLESDQIIDGTEFQPVLVHTIDLQSPARVLAIADGRYFPIDAPAGTVRIRFDGDDSYSSIPVTDWGSSQRPVMHAFNVLASTELAAGQHTVDLVASAHPSRPGRFAVGANSGLSLLVQPLSNLSIASLPGETAAINLTTYDPTNGIDVNEGDLDRPFVPILNNLISNQSGRSIWAISLASGRGFNACNSGIDDGFGDALLGIFSGGLCQSTHNAAWSVNDLDPDAELQAAMMLHSAHSLVSGEQRNLTLIGSELAFGSDQAGSPSGAHENGVCWGLGSARMITAHAGSVAGAAPFGPEQLCSTYTWRCVATTIGQPGCPPAGTNVTLTSAQIVIPTGHDGIVQFNARTRIQADNADGFATFILGLRIDGVEVGAHGVQQLAVGAGQASRTLSASYLSAPGSATSALGTGLHTVEVYLRAEGTLLNFPSAPQDLALTWFD